MLRFYNTALYFYFLFYFIDSWKYNHFPPDKLSGQANDIVRLNNVMDMCSSQWIYDLAKIKTGTCILY